MHFGTRGKVDLWKRVNLVVVRENVATFVQPNKCPFWSVISNTGASRRGRAHERRRVNIVMQLSTLTDFDAMFPTKVVGVPNLDLPKLNPNIIYFNLYNHRHGCTRFASSVL
jgi:hypothetical protein